MIDLPPWTHRILAALHAWFDDLVAAAHFLTRLPVSRFASPETGLLARSMRTFPIVGVLIGAVGWASFALARAVGLDSAIAALLTLLVTILMTGALHEDGLADTADGFGGGEDREARLEIMRDSRSGAFGVLALILSLGLRGAALAALGAAGSVGPALIAAHTVSRATLPVVMRFLEPARSDGLGANAGQPDEIAVLWCLGLGVLVAIVFLGFGRGLIALVVAAAAVASLGALARRRIGGYTGDVLGAAQQVGEIVMLLAAAA